MLRKAKKIRFMDELSTIPTRQHHADAKIGRFQHPTLKGTDDPARKLEKTQSEQNRKIAKSTSTSCVYFMLSESPRSDTKSRPIYNNERYEDVLQKEPQPSTSQSSLDELPFLDRTSSSPAKVDSLRIEEE